MFKPKVYKEVNTSELRSLAQKLDHLSDLYNQKNESTRRQLIVQKLPKHATDQELDKILNLQSSLNFNQVYVDDQSNLLIDFKSDNVLISPAYGNKDDYWYLEFRPEWMQEKFNLDYKSDLMINCFGETGYALKHTLITADKTCFLIHSIRVKNYNVIAEFDLHNEVSLVTIGKLLTA